MGWSALWDIVVAENEPDSLLVRGESQYPQLLSGCSHNFALIRQRLATCMTAHEKCQRPSLSFPLRLIDAGCDEGESDIASLRLTKELLESTTGIQYVALTYCWGKAPALVTTKATLGKHFKGIELRKMPTVLRDAVVVTRACGLRFLWIDALCICQDDEVEKLSEIANMGDIYAGSAMTLSALSSVGNDVGILYRRNLGSVLVGSIEGQRSFAKLYLRRRPMDIVDELQKAPYSRRAWTLQERLLAPAVVHFGCDQLLWECRTQELISETGDTDTERNRPAIEPVTRIGNEQWYKILRNYCGRQLTVRNDRLPAVAGLVSHLRQHGIRKGRYAGGLWEDTLIQDLTWSRSWRREAGGAPDHLHSGGQEPRPNVSSNPSIPTWSWAHIDGAMLSSKGMKAVTSSLRVGPNFCFDRGEEHTRNMLDSGVVHGCHVLLAGFVQILNDEFVQKTSGAGCVVEDPSVGAGDNDIGFDAGVEDDDEMDRAQYAAGGLPGDINFDTTERDPGAIYSIRLGEAEDASVWGRPIIYLLAQEADMSYLISCHTMPRQVYRRVGLLRLFDNGEAHFAKPYSDVPFRRRTKILLARGEWQEIALI